MVLSKEICCGFPVVIDVLDVSCNENNAKSWKKISREYAKKLFCIEISGVFPVVVVLQNNRKSTVFPRKNWSFVEVSCNEKDAKS